jgi:hypothetical protein
MLEEEEGIGDMKAAYKQPHTLSELVCTAVAEQLEPHRACF